MQYLSPGGNNPFELLEVAVAARDGDSGGPILNAQGELAGVLFGAARGRTAGSFCGRVQCSRFRPPPFNSWRCRPRRRCSPGIPLPPLPLRRRVSPRPT